MRHEDFTLENSRTFVIILLLKIIPKAIFYLAAPYFSFSLQWVSDDPGDSSN